MCRFLLAMFLLGAGRASYGQMFPMLHYTVEDGLPSNKVYGSFRDSKGFLWFCTDKGIARFNGIKFETFTTFSGLPDNEIFFLKEDREGRIWLSSYNGKLCYYKDGVFHSEINTPYLKLPFKSTYISYIDIADDGSVCFNFFDRRYIVNIDHERMRVYDLAPKIENRINTIIFSKKVAKDKYCIYMSGGKVYMDSAGVLLNKAPPARPYMRIVMSKEDAYFMDTKAVYDINYKEFYKFNERFLLHNYVNSLFFADGRTFVLSANGVFYNDSVNLLPGNNASSMKKDIIGNYWITTLNSGVFCLAKDFEQSRNYSNVYQGAMKYASVRNKQIFFTPAGDDLYMLKEGQPEKIFTSHLNEKDVDFSSVESSYRVDSNYNYYYFHDRNNIIIKGLTSEHPQVMRNDNPVISGAVKGIYPIGDVVYEKLRARICFFKLTDFDKHPFKYTFITDSNSPVRIMGMAEDSHNDLWYCTISNVFKIVHYKSIEQPQFHGVAFKTMVFCGQYLLGTTLDNSLIVCRNPDSGLVIDTLPPQGCIWDKMQVIDDKHVLISTNELYRMLTIDVENGKPVYTFNAIDNPFAPLNADAVCIDHSDCYFFKEGSIVKLDISSLLKPPQPPVLHFTYLREGNRQLPIGNEVTIPFQNKDIAIGFYALSFTGTRIVYEYSVSKDGSDNWVTLKGEEINLFNPRYGHYVVKVRAKSISGIFCAPIVFVLNIERPYWAAWWFVSLCSMVVIILVLLGVRYRIAQTVRRRDAANENKIRFMRSEYKALNALMNPHFIFNTLNNVQGLINSQDRLAANEYLRIFADMVRQNMHNISKDLISLAKEIELVENYLLLEKLRFKELLNFKIEIDEDVDASLIMVPPLLIQPLVENSIKHGILPGQSENGMVVVHVYEKGSTLFVEVRDNGVGMHHGSGKSDTMHESFALTNIRNRLEQLSVIIDKKVGFDISEEHTETGPWTVVTISIENI